MLRRRLLEGHPGGLRLDEALSRMVPELSRARLQKLVRRGAVRLDGRVVYRSAGRVGNGTRIEIHLDPPPLRILHCDDSLAILDKPAGLLSHGFPGCREVTLCDQAQEAFGPLPEGAGGGRPGVVHRLDRETSGLLLLARTDSALLALKAQFRSRSVRKRYLALCSGSPPRESWSCERPLGPAPGGGSRQWIDPPTGGKEAHTDFRLLQRRGELCWIEARPRTGRRHQVRLHLCASGLSVVDDPLYQARGAPRPPKGARIGRCALHADSLELRHPDDGRPLRFEAPWPSDLGPAPPAGNSEE